MTGARPVETPDMGDLHVVLSGHWSSAHARAWEESGANSLGYDPEGSDASFLPTLPGLRKLRLVGQCSDDSAVGRCHDLLALSLYTDAQTPLDLRHLVKLQDLPSRVDFLRSSCRRWAS